MATFSVVIPLYNKEQTIKRAICSVLKQTAQDFEIIVVNDGSTDGGAQIIESIKDTRIRVINQENQGVSAARYRGINEAMFDLVAFLDADDEWLPSFLEAISRLIEVFPNCSTYATRYFLNYSGILRPAIVRGLSSDFEGILNNYFRIAAISEPPIHTNSVCAKKSTLQRIGGFPIGVVAGEDLLTWARLAIHGDIVYSMMCHSIHYVNVGKFEPGRIVDTVDLVGNELVKLLHTSSNPYSLRRYIALWHRMRASTFFRHRMQIRALAESVKSLYFNPFECKTYLFLLAAIIPYSSMLLPIIRNSTKITKYLRSKHSIRE